MTMTTTVSNTVQKPKLLMNLPLIRDFFVSGITSGFSPLAV